MTALLLAGASALWLGLLTSMSPCPLATNVAAVSYVGRQVTGRRAALASAAAYVIGRAVAYTVVAAIVVAGLLSVPAVAGFLERYMNRLLGPVLVAVGMILLGLLPWTFSTRVGSEALHRRVAARGALGALGLGTLFALSFCPVSAALFFGSLIPLAVDHQSTFGLPVLYGLGTGLPVLAVAVPMALGVGRLATVVDRMAAVERWTRRVTGVVFLAVGAYYTVQYVFLAP